MGRGMGKPRIASVRLAALAFAGIGTAFVTAPAAAAADYGYARPESPGDTLARNLRILATSPSDFSALIGAGKAALQVGDSQAAAGFFARAEEVSPRSPMPQAGMGAALAHDGDPNGALRYFASAVRFGATQQVIGAERGLAYDLLGQHALAQADYRVALNGPDADEARRRLALSLAISGNQTDALATLAPLMARGDSAGARCRAFVLALTGDQAGARAMINARMPGNSAQMAYFFSRLPTLSSPQKAAAVHLGVFPGSGQPSYAAATRQPADDGDRLASIDYYLSNSAAPAVQAPQQPVQLASASRVRRDQLRSDSQPDGRVYSRERIWLQLASGKNPAALPEQFRRIKSRGGEVLEGISGYVVEERDRARLLIGPFRNSGDAEIFAEDLASLRVDAFSWTSEPGQIIRKLSTE